MQNLNKTPNAVILDNNFGRSNNETSHYSDSDSWDTDFEDEGIESAELYGDVDSQREELNRARNQYNVAALTKTVAASLQLGSSENSGHPRLKKEVSEVHPKPAVPERPAFVASTASVKNKTVSSLPKPPCQASEHVRQVIGNLGHLWPPEKAVSTKQNDDDYEPIVSEGESPGSSRSPSTPKVPPETQKSFLHSSSSSTGTPSSSSSTASASGAIPTRRAPPRPAGPPGGAPGGARCGASAGAFVHGASAASALSRLAGVAAVAAAAAAEASKQSQQQFAARTSRTLPVETKEKCVDDKRAATLPTALSPPPSTSPLPPPVSNRPLPPTPAGNTSASNSSASTSSGANLASTLVSRPWFHDIDRRRAEELVRNGADGYFLVRPSSQSTNALTLTMWYNQRVYNISIRLRTDNRIALGTAKPNEQSFATVDEMVANYQSENLVLFSGGERTGLTVLTTYPPHKN